MDTLSSKARSERMARVRSLDTRPEMVVRRMLHARGYRFRLHVRGLPGVPDIVFPSRHKVIFVHGCFWHRHRCSHGRSMPASNVSFWQAKFGGNKERDRRHRRRLRRMGWRVLVAWECETTTAKQRALMEKLRQFLGPAKGGREKGSSLEKGS